MIEEPNDFILKKIREDFSIVNGVVTRNTGNTGSPDSKGYTKFKILNHTIYAAHISWYLSRGTWPVDEIDHRDRNKLNNAPDNLRDISHGENMRNRATTNKYGTGVKKNKKGGYEVYFRVNGQKQYMGWFKTAEEAAEHYQTLLKTWNKE